jgi:8-amino-7-oxononanoate synthase
MKWPDSLQKKENERLEIQAWRVLSNCNPSIDFYSNDYLGLASNFEIFEQGSKLVLQHAGPINGATGSRLLSGNYPMLAETEQLIAQFHQTASALLFNSGYDANVGFFQAVPQKGDLILYDENCHASIRDGIRQCFAKHFKIRHNETEHLKELLNQFSSAFNTIYVVTESVFSMDGDCPPMEEWVTTINEYGAYLVVDEAHALGVFGKKGEGLIQDLGLTDEVFARIVTFGKGLGCHGAAVLGSKKLIDYLVNFARSFIYTTAMTPHSCASIQMAYKWLLAEPTELKTLRNRIQWFNQEKRRLGINAIFIYSKSAIHCAIIPGVEKVKNWATILNENGFSIKPILSPTVPAGQERLRICLHSYQSEEEITALLGLLHDLVYA